MEKSGFFNAMKVGDTWDRVYKAENYAEYFATFIGNGVFPNPAKQLQVLETDRMNVIIKSGKAWINGYRYENTDDLIVPIDTADGVLHRIDKVVLRYDVEKREIRACVKKGEFSSTPTAPELTRNADMYELALADIRVSAGAIKVSQSDITDLRLNKELCGIVHGVVDQVDTTAIFNQFQSWYTQTKEAYDKNIAMWTKDKKEAFDKWYKESTKDFLKQWNEWFENTGIWEKDFNNWFETLKDKLDGNIAAKLTKDVEQLKKDVENIDIPVKSVNKKTGDIELKAADITTENGQTIETQLDDKANKDGTLQTNLNTEKINSKTANKVPLTNEKTDIIGMVNEVFQCGNDVKEKIVTAIKAKNKNVTINDNWDNIINNLKNLNCGLDDDIKELFFTRKLNSLINWSYPYTDQNIFDFAIISAYAILNEKLMLFIRRKGNTSDDVILLDKENERWYIEKYNSNAITLDHSYSDYKYNSSPYYVNSRNRAVTLKDKVYLFAEYKGKIFTIDSNLKVEKITNNIAIQNKQRYCPAVFNENLYIIGGCGYFDTSNMCKDVWKLKDNDWLQISSSVPFKSTNASYIVLKNELYIISETIWKTTDCITWTQVNSNYANSIGYIYGFLRACIFNNKVYMIVNSSDEKKLYYTEDFINFKRPKTDDWLNIGANNSQGESISDTQFLFSYKNNLLAISKHFSTDGGHNYSNSLNKIYHYIK